MTDDQPMYFVTVPPFGPLVDSLERARSELRLRAQAGGGEDFLIVEVRIVERLKRQAPPLVPVEIGEASFFLGDEQYDPYGAYQSAMLRQAQTRRPGFRALPGGLASVGDGEIGEPPQMTEQERQQFLAKSGTTTWNLRNPPTDKDDHN